MQIGRSTEAAEQLMSQTAILVRDNELGRKAIPSSSTHDGERGGQSSQKVGAYPIACFQRDFLKYLLDRQDLPLSSSSFLY